MMAQAAIQMIAEIHWRGQNLRIDLASGVPIAIPLLPGGPQPAFFAPAPMTASALQLDGFTGDVRSGGSCNVSVLAWAPHCHGTHTECIGHILSQEVFVLDTISQEPCLARLVSVSAEPGSSLISLPQLQQALANGLESYAALLVRTLPNDPSKRGRDYAVEPDYPVLDPACMQFLAASGLQHLLLDTPSLDAMDNANLANHRTWWGLDKTCENSAAHKRSVTEMIFVPEDLQDGDYWLELQLSPLQSDACPSRPVLYPVEHIDSE